MTRAVFASRKHADSLTCGRNETLLACIPNRCPGKAVLPPWILEKMKHTSGFSAFLFVFVATAALGAPPQRVVCLAPSLTAMVTGLGCQSQLAAVTPFCEAPPSIARIRGGMEPEAESVLALDPDLVLATPLTPQGTLEQLRHLDLRVEQFDPKSLDQIRDTIRRIADLLGVAAPDDAPAKTAHDTPCSAVLLFGADTGYSAGEGTHANEILSAAGLRNIAAQTATPWPQLSEEFILSQDPDIVIVADYGSTTKSDVLAQLRNHPVRSQLRAVKAGKVVVLPAPAFSVPGPAALRAGESLRTEVEKL